MPNKTTGLMPAAANYQPLQLENFAQPLGQMQQKYDATTTALEDAGFGIGVYDEIDKEKATKKELELVTKKDEILDNLKKNKDYRTAAKELKQLNKIWNEDPEITGLRSQKAIYESAREKELEKLKKNKITEKDFADWEAQTRIGYRKQGGYGEGKSLQVPMLYDNLEDDMFKFFSDISKGMPLQKITAFEEIGSTLNFSEGDKKLLEKITVDFKKKDQMVPELYNFFSQHDGYRDYLNNRAERQFVVEGARNPNHAFEVIQKSENELQKSINEVRQDSSISESDKKEMIASLQNQLELLDQHTQQAFSDGNIEDLALQLHLSNYADKELLNLSDAAADLFDVKKIGKSHEERGSVGRIGRRLKNIEETVGIINTQVTPVQAGSSEIGPGVGSGNTAIQEAALGHSLELVQSLQTDKILPAFVKNTAEGKDIKARKYTTALENYFTYHDNHISELTTQIEEIESKMLDPNTSLNEERKLRADLKNLHDKRNTTRINKEPALNYVENVLTNNIDKLDDFPELKEAFEKDGVKGVLDKVKNVDIAKENENYDFKIANLKADLFEITTKYRQGEMSPKNYGDKRSQIEKQIQESSTVYKETISDKNQVLEAFNNWVDTYKKEMSFKSVVPTEEIIYDKQFKAFFGENVVSVLDNIFDLPTAAPGRFSRVDFDTATGEITSGDFKQMGIPEINKDLYNLDAPRLIAMDDSAGNEKPVFRISRNRMTEAESFKEATGLNAFSKAGTEALKEYQTALSNAGGKAQSINTEKLKNGHIIKEFVDWQMRNPEDLFVAIEGVNVNLRNEADQMFEETTRRAIETQDKEIMENIASSYATIALVSSPQINRDYKEMASTLQRAFQNKNKEMNTTQSPHTWVPVDIGGQTLYQGNSIDFRYDEARDGMVAIVYQNTSDGDDILDTKQIETIPLSTISPKILKKLSVYYGTGSEKEKIIGKDGQSFVPSLLMR